MSSSYFYSQCDCPTCSPTLHRAFLDQSWLPVVPESSPNHLGKPEELAHDTIARPEAKARSRRSTLIGRRQTLDSSTTSRSSRSTTSSSSSATITPASLTTSISSSAYTTIRRVLSNFPLRSKSKETPDSKSLDKHATMKSTLKRPRLRRATSEPIHPTTIDLVNTGINVSTHPYQCLEDSSWHPADEFTILEEGWVQMQTNLDGIDD